jgi:hypothetical protein
MVAFAGICLSANKLAIKTRKDRIKREAPQSHLERLRRFFIALRIRRCAILGWSYPKKTLCKFV